MACLEIGTEDGIEIFAQNHGSCKNINGGLGSVSQVSINGKNTVSLAKRVKTRTLLQDIQTYFDRVNYRASVLVCLDSRHSVSRKLLLES
jgi:hypothetical protein